jgi:rhamnosyltransferase
VNAVVSVSVIVPTLNGAGTLPALLAGIGRAAGRHAVEIVAVDSGSSDATIALLRGAGAVVMDLGGVPFGHASSRNRGAAQARGDVLVFVTQDVEPVGDGWLEPLLAALAEPRVAGAFGRQIPRGASPEEAFLAGVNYPATPRRLTAADLEVPFGPGRTYFSTAFGALKRAVWAQIPFPDVVMSEDQAWARDALRAGHEVRYVPDAAVYHGHAFALTRAFRRNFDSGSSLEALGLAGASWRSGFRHLAGEVRWIARERGVTRLPSTLCYEGARMAGFQLGRLERAMPRGLVRALGEAARG